MLTQKQGRHQATEGRSRWRRKIAGIPMVGWMLGAMGGTALAAWLILGGFSGSVTTAQLDMELLSASATDQPCTVTADTGLDQVNVAWPDAKPGVCIVTMTWEQNAANTTSAFLQRFDLTSADFAGGGVTAALGGDCGLEWPAGQSNQYQITVDLTLDASASSPGDSFTFDPTLDGVVFGHVADPGCV